MTARHCVIAALIVVGASGCATEAPDYQSILSTTPTTATTSATEAPEPVAAYLDRVGVSGDPVVAPDKMPDLTVTLPMPAGWQPYHNPNFAPGTKVIAKGETYPIAMLVALRLNGNFDPNEAVKHGYADAEMSQNFKRLNASTDNWKGFPSSMIEGSYDLNGARMHSYNRIVFATGAAPANQRYLVQFTVTGYAEKAVEEAPDIEKIIGGFNVAVPKAPPK
ncbi:LpqN/LpqT family lipoprotein [Mycobacterium deserti]|uniref:LpqN/LpqT family lipoprotein n=1 Tax=Mycobacterium deserti TaxID=2978347 RepID=A0ABT2M7E5_9MYCO|nr:LpqN/LpqT family lipoprotein [Mycobacterium deserti]MCT7657325.1 LpqN/LpqT family lipoprotein [Mycobacterium deserti]